MENEGHPRRRTAAVVSALSLLYLAQGIPFGFATEYLPVVLRSEGYSYAAIAALSWLQLPWQLKAVWAKLADHPRVRPRTRTLILVLQLALTATVAAFGVKTLREGAALWFVLTAVAAALAATQDVFVDAFAVRALRPSERGYGNTAQVAGYRLGMLIGGAALLLLVGSLGERATLLGCAGVVGACSVGAFVSGGAAEEGGGGGAGPGPGGGGGTGPMTMAGLVRHMLGAEAWVVIVLALTFKLGLHMASSLLKPMAVDYGWTKQQIGSAVVTVGSIGALVGAAAGGALHRAVGERRALAIAMVVQALTCLPLVVVERMHAPLGLTTVTLALEHFGSGLGTTVLFAALMTATRPADAGLHYTVLTSANAFAIGVGGLLGALIADHAGKVAAFVVATIVCLLPAPLVRRWSAAARASAAGR